MVSAHLTRQEDPGPEGWSSRDKFAAVLESAALNEAYLAAEKIKAKVQLAPRAQFTIGFMLFLQPFSLSEDLQPSAVHDQMQRVGIL
jgi:hypothetical protein